MFFGPKCYTFVLLTQQLKKVFALFLSVIFVASAMQLTINAHYCGNELESIGFSPGKCCCDDGAAMKDDCCKNETHQLKINDDFSPSALLIIPQTEFNVVLFCISFEPLQPEKVTFSIPNDHSPPPQLADKVIAFRSLLI